MAQDDDADLPLHDEAKARSKWRDGETILDKGGEGTSGPASEIDNASQPGGSGGAGDSPPAGLVRMPPD